MRAGRQKLKPRANHLRSARAINDGVQFTLTAGVAEGFTDVGCGLAFGADDVISSIFLGDRKLVWMTRKSHYRCATSQQLGVLHCVRAQPANPEHSKHPVWTESTRIAQFFDAA